MKRKAALCLVAFAVPAAAANWEPFFRGGGKTIYYIDSASVAQEAAGLRKAWVRAVYDEPRQEPEGKAGYSVALIAIKCPERKMSQRQVTTHSPDGSALSSSKLPIDDWTEVAPETMGEALYDRVCKRPLPK